MVKTFRKLHRESIMVIILENYGEQNTVRTLKNFYGESNTAKTFRIS